MKPMGLLVHKIGRTLAAEGQLSGSQIQLPNGSIGSFSGAASRDRGSRKPTANLRLVTNSVFMSGPPKHGMVGAATGTG